MLANYVLVDNLYHFNWPIVGGNPMLKEDEWNWQECGKMKAATARMAILAGWPVGFLTSAVAAIRSRLWDLVPNGIKVPNIVPLKVPILHPCPQSPELYD